MHSNINAEKLLERGATLADILALFSAPVIVGGTSDQDAATVPPPALER